MSIRSDEKLNNLSDKRKFNRSSVDDHGRKYASVIKQKPSPRFPKHMKSRQAMKSQSSVKPRTNSESKRMPKIKIKVGVQSNQFNFFNSIKEDENDEDVIRIVEVDGRRTHNDISQRYKRGGKKTKGSGKDNQQKLALMLPTMTKWEKQDLSSIKAFYK